MRLKDLLYYDKWRMPKFVRTRQMLSAMTNTVKTKLLPPLRRNASRAWGFLRTKWASKKVRGSAKAVTVVVGVILIIRFLWNMMVKWISNKIHEQIPQDSLVSQYLNYDWIWNAFWIILFIGLPILGIWFAHRQYRKVRPKKPATTPGTPASTPPPPSSWEWPSWLVPDKDTVWLIVGWAFLLYSPIVFGTKGVPGSLRDWWWNNVLTDKVGWWFIIGFSLFGAMMFRKTAFRYKLAYIGTAVLVVSLVGVYGSRLRGTFSSEEVPKRAPKATATSISATPSGLAKMTYDAENYTFPPELANNENARKVYDQLMADKSLSKPDAYNLFFMCGEETSFSYSPFEKDGVTPFIGHNPDGTDNGARGTCQVKPAVYGEIAKQLTASTGLDHSFETLEGQVRLASYVLRTHGGSQWAKLGVVLERARNAQQTETARVEQGATARPAEVHNADKALMLQGGILVPVVKEEQIDRVVPMIAPIGGQYSAPIAWLRNTATVEALDGDIYYITENMKLAARLKKGEKAELKGANSVSILDARGLQYWQADEDRIHVIITRW